MTRSPSTPFVSTLTILYAVAFFVALIVAGCSVAPVPNMYGNVQDNGTSADDVVLTGHKLCSSPAIVYMPMDTPWYEEEILWRAFAYYNDEVGMDLFVRGGILTSPTIVTASSPEAGPQSALIVEYTSENDIRKVSSQLGASAGGFFRTLVRTGECISIGYLGIDPIQRISPANTEAIMTHEIGHSLGLGHSGNPGSVMYFIVSEVEDLVFKSSAPDDQIDYYPATIPSLGSVEIAIIRSIYQYQVR